MPVVILIVVIIALVVIVNCVKIVPQAHAVVVKNRKKQRGKKNISGHYKIALKSIKKEWNRSLPQVQKAMRMVQRRQSM